MGNVSFVFGLISFIWCIKLSSRLTKMERILKQTGLGTDNTKSLYNVLIKNIDKSVTLTFCNGDTLLGNKKINCEILDVDEEWILLKETKKTEQ